MSSRDWREIRAFDDALPQCEIGVVVAAEKEANGRCPYLGRMDMHFYFCSSAVRTGSNHTAIDAYSDHVSGIELKEYCMGDHEKCCFVTGEGIED